MPTLELLTRRVPLTPSSVDDKERTVRVIWSTGATVQRRDFEGPFLEVLSLDPAHVRLDSLKGASVLDSHGRNSVRDVLGVVVDAGIDGSEGWASVKFSSRAEVAPIWQDISDGIIRHVSVGYTVETWKDTIANGVRTRTAVAWTPREISFVALPADAGATVRSLPEMPEVQTPGTGAPENRAEINAEIRSIARVAGLDTAFADGLIDHSATVDQARAAAFEAMRAKAGPAVRTESVITIGTDLDDPAVRAGWMGEALYTRLDPSHKPSEQARQYVGLSLPEMGREILRLRGISTVGMPATTNPRNGFNSRKARARPTGVCWSGCAGSTGTSLCPS